MAKRAAKSVTLTARQGALVDKLVRDGRFPSGSAVVEESMRLLAEHEKTRAEKIKLLRRELEKGSRSIARGDIHDAADVFAELDRREVSATQRRRRKSA